MPSDVATAQPDPIVELLQAWLARGCQVAGGALWRLMEPHIGRAISAYPALQNEAADLSQQAAMRAFGSFRRFDVSRPLGPWLRRLTHNVCLDQLRARGRRRETSFSMLELEAEHALAACAGHEPGPAARLLAGERQVTLQRCVARLPRSERRVLETLMEEEMDPERTAARLGCERRVLKFRVCRARVRLRKEWLAMAA